MPRVIENLSGKQFGEWTVLGLAFDKKYDQHTYWYVKCSCGEIDHTRADSLKSLTSKKCKKCKHKTQHKEDFALNTIYHNYKKSALKRNLSFNLSKDAFRALLAQSCHFCGTQPFAVWKYAAQPLTYNGVDRVDNSKGYDEGNCVSCCKTCNLAKSTMSVSEFLGWIDRVYSFQHKNK
jgi:hypothetical protein